MGEPAETTRHSKPEPRTPKQWAGLAALCLLAAVVFNVLYAGTDYVWFGFGASVSVLCVIGAAAMAVGTWGWRAVRGR